jgi:pimeloyl-ACP methyl ester carboxylesterase
MNVALVPGTMCDERIWRYLLPKLASQIRPSYVSLSNIVDRESARQMLAQQIVGNSHIIGFSMGGYLALEYAVAHPEQVSSLVIVAASAAGLTPQEKVRRQRMLVQLSNRSYAGVSRQQLEGYVAPKSQKDAKVIGTIIEMDRALGGSVLQAQMRATLDRPDLIHLLSAIHCPVLIVGGANDKLVRLGDLHDMNSRLRNSRFRILEGSGHMIPLEAPRELGNEINDFYRFQDFF